MVRERKVGMLSTLRVRNLALVTDLAVQFPDGLVVITGETGAGKSIILGALDLVLGERADRTLIREGADHCAVEAVFDIRRMGPDLPAWLESHGLEPCEDHQLVLKRVCTAAGANRQFVNGSPTSLSHLATIGNGLVDMHGPHDHQSLLQPARQLALIDAFGHLETQVAGFGDLLRQRQAREAEKAALIVDERTYAQQLDLLRFQVNEIRAAQLRPDEEEEVEAAYRRASNGARLLELSQTAIRLLDEDEHSLSAQAGALGRLLAELQRLDSATDSLAQLQQEFTETLTALQTAVSRYADKVELDPERLATLEERLNLLQGLKRKYGTTLAEVLAFGDSAAEKLRQWEGREAELVRLNEELKRLDTELARAGRELTRQRRGALPRLAKAVGRQLADLGFRQSRFEVALTPLPQPSYQGEDAVEFEFAPNPGEPPRPLRAIASSGEMARVMLAIKTVLAAEDAIPVLVFDEVDANVGGETANAVGEKMRQIARQRQVFCITHLPQVAAAGTAHFAVTKQVRDRRTVSEINPLTEAERVTELARMLGGQSEVARHHAAALLGKVSGKGQR